MTGRAGFRVTSNALYVIDYMRHGIPGHVIHLLIFTKHQLGYLPEGGSEVRSGECAPTNDSTYTHDILNAVSCTL